MTCGRLYRKRKEWMEISTTLTKNQREDKIKATPNDESAKKWIISLSWPYRTAKTTRRVEIAFYWNHLNGIRHTLNRFQSHSLVNRWDIFCSWLHFLGHDHINRNSSSDFFFYLLFVVFALFFTRLFLGWHSVTIKLTASSAVFFFRFDCKQIHNSSEIVAIAIDFLSLWILDETFCSILFRVFFFFASERMKKRTITKEMQRAFNRRWPCFVVCWDGIDDIFSVHWF